MLKERYEYSMACPENASNYIERVSKMSYVERMNIREIAKDIGRKMVLELGFSTVSIGMAVRRCAESLFENSRIMQKLGISHDEAGDVSTIASLIAFEDDIKRKMPFYFEDRNVA
jgi:hypothetical protein